jgi:putative flippase GtrA
MLNNEKIRYLLVGCFNTLAGYSIGVGIYAALKNNFDIVLIGLIANFFSISVSFLTYKIIVFKTKGMWLSEYMKSFMIYGGIALVGIFFLWLFVAQIKISIWIAQALVIGVTVIFSYKGHSRFTFRRK